MTAHITKEITQEQIISECGHVVNVPKHLQNKLPIGKPHALNPEYSDCQQCRDVCGLGPVKIF